jgi:hypothetical protein
MIRIKRLMKLHRLSNVAGEHGSDAGSSGGNAVAQTQDSTAAAATTATETAPAQKEGDPGTAGTAGQPPSDADAKLLKDLMKHKTRAKELETSLTQVNDQLKAFEGLDPVKMRELLKQQEEIEQKAMESRGEYDRLIKQMGDRHQEEKRGLETQFQEIRTQNSTLQQQIADLTVGNAFSGSKFVSEDLTLTVTKARVIYGNHFEFKDGVVVGYDKPAGASERTVLVDSSGDPLKFDEALRKLVESDPDKDQLIRTKAKQGAGSNTSAKGAKAAIEAAASRNSTKLSPAEKIAAGLKMLAKA